MVRDCICWRVTQGLDSSIQGCEEGLPDKCLKLKKGDRCDCGEEILL